MLDLGILPGIRLSVRACDRAERTNTSRAEVDSLDIGEDLIDILIFGRAGDQSTLVLEDGVGLSGLTSPTRISPRC